MKLGYKAALAWIVLNDDCEWLDDDEPIISVTAAFYADIYDKSNEQIIADLQKTKEKLK